MGQAVDTCEDNGPQNLMRQTASGLKLAAHTHARVVKFGRHEGLKIP